MGEIVLALSFIVAIIGLVRYKRLTMPFKILSLYLVFSFILNVVDSYLVAKYKNNTPITHIEALCDYIFIAFIYYYFFKSKNIKQSILISIVLITIFSFVNALFLQPYNTDFATYVRLPTEVLYVIFSILLFNKMLLYPTQVNIIKQSIFWFNTAMLLCYSTVFLSTALENYFKNHHSNYIIYYFWYGSAIIFNVFMGIAVLTDKKETLFANTKLSDTL